MGIMVRPFEEGDRGWADAGISAHQGSSLSVRLGELIDPLVLPGLVAERDGQRLGVLTYIVDGDQFEVLSLHSQVEGSAPAARCWRRPPRWRAGWAAGGCGWSPPVRRSVTG